MSFHILPVDIGLGDGAGIPVRLHSIPSILTISSPQTLSVRLVAKLPPFPADDEEPVGKFISTRKNWRLRHHFCLLRLPTTQIAWPYSSITIQLKD